MIAHKGDEKPEKHWKKFETKKGEGKRNISRDGE